MTVREWLEARRPEPPAALTARLNEVLGDGADRDLADCPEVLMAAGERLVSSLLAGDVESRGSALDLLVADALVTYAFEAASADAASIATRASDAMGRIAALPALTP